MKSFWFPTLSGLLAGSSNSGLPSHPPPCVLDPSLNCINVEPYGWSRLSPGLVSERWRVDYGRFTVPAVDDAETMGMKTLNFPISPPCQDCFVTYYRADLRYADDERTEANTNTGMWLHHLVIFNLIRTMTACPENMEAAFSSGNERTGIDLSVGGTRRTGYHIAPETQFYLAGEFMNKNHSSRDVVVSIEWEFVPKPRPLGQQQPGDLVLRSYDDFKHLTPVWLDIDGACQPHGSEVSLPANASTVKGRYEFSMEPAWKVLGGGGEVVWGGFHMHDGAESIRVNRKKNGNGGEMVVVCKSEARYGEWGVFVGTRDDGVTQQTHLSSMSFCDFKDEKDGGRQTRVEPGDEWSITAVYDLAKHAAIGSEGEGGSGHHHVSGGGMDMGGSGLDPIMGVALLYVAMD